MLDSLKSSKLQKRSRTRLAPNPTSISSNSEPEVRKNGTWASPAIALANKVLPLPGKPTRTRILMGLVLKKPSMRNFVDDRWIKSKRVRLGNFDNNRRHEFDADIGRLDDEDGPDVVFPVLSVTNLLKWTRRNLSKTIARFENSTLAPKKGAISFKLSFSITHSSAAIDDRSGSSSHLTTQNIKPSDHTGNININCNFNSFSNREDQIREARHSNRPHCSHSMMATYQPTLI
uniref:Uncharacterized protein n=1 Tax=Romanomermis culicivorax TaxID=13658 RepID=A0A915JDD5_ROMCU